AFRICSLPRALPGITPQEVRRSGGISMRRPTGSTTCCSVISMAMAGPMCLHSTTTIGIFPGGGVSRWETVNVSGQGLGNFAVGNFVGDYRDDIFYADGTHWYASDAATGQFIALDVASSRVSNLRFGDFNGDGRTDVFGISGGNWAVAFGGTSGWQPLRSKLSDSVSNLMVADFNGDDHADVVMPFVSVSGLTLQISYNGTGNWQPLRSFGLTQLSGAVIGRFDQMPGADLLMWANNYLV